MAQKILLDTDIGDDVDDALALALICAMPELELLGVSTVFGNVVARAKQARSILAVAGGAHRNIPVAAGCGAGLGSRPLDSIAAYLEGRIPNQDGACLPEAQLPKLDTRHGVDLIIETIMAGAGDIIPVTIGAMTNLAVALTKERKIAAKIPKIVVMAAEVKSAFAEWNIRCDPEAASIVFQSGIPIDVTTWEMGHIASFDNSHIERLKASKRPMGIHLMETIEYWRKQSGQHNMPSLFDPLAIATMVHPQLIQWKQGHISVELQGSTTYGFTTFNEDAKGKHRVAWSVDRDSALNFYIDRVLSL